MGTVMTEELQGALAMCGFLALLGGMVFLLGHDSTFKASDKTKRFWKWWTIFWFSPLAFHLLRIVWLG